MAGSLNKVMLIGRLGRDPELRYTQSGIPVCNFTMATDESYQGRDGQKVEQTEWHKVVVWGKQAETVTNYLSKGRLCYVEGSLQTRKWQDQQGQDRWTTEVKAQRVQFLDSQRDAQTGQGQGGYAPQGGYDDYDQEYGPPQGGNPQQRRQGPPQGQGRQGQPARDYPDEDLGPAFPSEAGDMDEVPF